MPSKIGVTVILQEGNIGPSMACIANIFIRLSKTKKAEPTDSIQKEKKESSVKSPETGNSKKTEKLIPVKKQEKNKQEAYVCIALFRSVL